MSVYRRPFIVAEPSPVQPLDSIRVHGRLVVRGCRIHVEGLRGQSQVYAINVHDNGCVWLDVITARGRQRSIRPDAVRVVHNKGAK